MASRNDSRIKKNPKLIAMKQKGIFNYIMYAYKIYIIALLNI